MSSSNAGIPIISSTKIQQQSNQITVNMNQFLSGMPTQKPGNSVQMYKVVSAPPPNSNCIPVSVPPRTNHKLGLRPIAPAPQKLTISTKPNSFPTFRQTLSVNTRERVTQGHMAKLTHQIPSTVPQPIVHKVLISSHPGPGQQQATVTDITTDRQQQHHQLTAGSITTSDMGNTRTISLSAPQSYHQAQENNSQSYVVLPTNTIGSSSSSSSADAKSTQIVAQSVGSAPSQTRSSTLSRTLFQNVQKGSRLLSSSNYSPSVRSSYSLEGSMGVSSTYSPYIPSSNKRRNSYYSMPPGPPGTKPKKPCNCTRSQCLKLYCDCFAAGEFCQNCNCISCMNNLEHEETRHKAIEYTKERNPHAFRPKVGKMAGGAHGERRHQKGCNCKKSNCLKNYCECYEGRILCSALCKCIGCKNYKDYKDPKALTRNAERKLTQGLYDYDPKAADGDNDERLPHTLINEQVIDAVCGCLLAQAETEAQLQQTTSQNISDRQQERSILMEFGRCMVQIIEAARRTRPPTPDHFATASITSQPTYSSVVADVGNEIEIKEEYIS